MKKIIYLFLTTSLIFSSCSKEKDTVTSINGCTSATACNYNENATMDDGSCDLPNGCGDPLYLEYDATVTCSAANACLTLDIRNELVGEFNGAGTITSFSASDGTSSVYAALGKFKCEKLGSSQVLLIIEDFLAEGEDLTIPCNQITQVAGGLTFIIPDKDGIIRQNPDGTSGAPYILNGENGPQNYNSADRSMSFSFAMENGQWLYEVTLTGTN